MHFNLGGRNKYSVIGVVLSDVVYSKYQNKVIMLFIKRIEFCATMSPGKWLRRAQRCPRGDGLQSHGFIDVFVTWSIVSWQIIFLYWAVVH